MKVLIQRVKQADVQVDGFSVGKIGQGLLVFVGLEKHDTQASADKLIKKLLSFRIFSDNEDKMNWSIQDINGGILAVSQFTLAADTRKGNRPGFSSAMPPSDAEPLFAYFYEALSQQHPNTAQGQFGADMQVSLVNDGPVTFQLQIDA